MPFRESTYQVFEAMQSREIGPVFKEQTTSANSASNIRNFSFILSYLSGLFSNNKKVFEVGSGTGHHACLFATELPHLQWQTSDAIQPYCDKIKATVQEAGKPANVLDPVIYSTEAKEIPGECDAVYMSNILHCMSADNASRLVQQAGEALPEGGSLVIYGPFKFFKDRYDIALNDGQGNANFDQKLKKENPAFGIKNMQDVRDYAKPAGLKQSDCFWHEASNNYLLVFKKQNPLRSEADYDLSCLEADKYLNFQ